MAQVAEAQIGSLVEPSSATSHMLDDQTITIGQIEHSYGLASLGKLLVISYHNMVSQST
ncbi:hypothetical protein [Herpetosiphon geysericola]|uniref:hypothetical protein n=1 Tax=Herpetosiphon geysericola TaxID=70996 RepID=UPI001364B96E|nr:hypothetical protein [Herpetosiphon geysericola]